MKRIIKILVLLVTFVGAFLFFVNKMDVRMLREKVKTVKMAEATLPVITLETDGRELNELHGYTSNLDVMAERNAVLALEKDKTFWLNIYEYETVVRRVHYELYNTTDGKLMEEDTMSAFDESDGRKRVKIAFKSELSERSEYAMKVVITDSKSDKIYFYFRITYLQDAKLKEKLDLAMDYSENARDKSSLGTKINPYTGNTIDKNKISAYLDANTKDDVAFTDVTLNSSFFMNSWGNLAPEAVGNIIPTVTEISADIAVVVLKYVVKLETDDGTEYFNVTEDFRVSYNSVDFVINNYERRMELIFDVALTSTGHDAFLLGITSNPEVKMYASEDKNLLAFVRNRELWYYNVAENTMYKVFSFIEENDKFDIRASYDQHDIRILRMDEEGNVDFMVYGYMNRGSYEGKVGILVYTYFKDENRIEERIYIPIEYTYQMLKEDIGEFGSFTSGDVFYCMVYHTVYKYNLITRELSVVSDTLDDSTFVFSVEQGYFAWQDKGDYSKFHIRYMESDRDVIVDSYGNEGIRILGESEGNIIFGRFRYDDVVVESDGSVIRPVYSLVIADGMLNILKTYEKSRYYVTDVKVSSTSIEIERIYANSSPQFGFVKAENEYILNKEYDDKAAFTVGERSTELLYSEYMMYFPAGYTIDRKPALKTVLNTVISEDTTVRIAASSEKREAYYVYAFGSIRESFSDIAGAISCAYDNIGIVVDQNNNIMWERSVAEKARNVMLSGITYTKATSTRSSVQAVVQMMVYFKQGKADIYDINDSTVLTDYLTAATNKKAVSLRGLTVEEVLYFIYKGQPVLAMKDKENAVLITSYNYYSKTITYYDPQLKESIVMSNDKNDEENAETFFGAAGNVFISFIE